MEDLFSLLLAINQKPISNQRELAQIMGISVGKVNGLIREAADQGCLTIEKEGKQSRFRLTNKGRLMLEDILRSLQRGKLMLEESRDPVRIAVILAGGKRPDFALPAALLSLGEQTIIDRDIQVLESCGIQRFFVITGFCGEMLQEHLAGKQNVTFVENPRYKWSGTMQALALLENHLTEDFLVLKSDLVFERRGALALLEGECPFQALLAAPSGRGDQAFVELDREGDIFRISKDIHQINRTQGELVGMARVSAQVYRMMLDYFRENENPLLHFEYVLENIGRLYRFRGQLVDDLIWGKVETEESYRELLNLTFPRIQRKEKEMQEQLAADTIVSALGVQQEEITEISFAGGLTNTNYDVRLKTGRYILRLPGRMTESLIDRKNEERNARLASDRGFNCPLIYCDPDSGVKISEYIDGAETLTPQTVKLEENIRLTAEMLKALHTSGMEEKNCFDPFAEALRYESLLQRENAQMYQGYDQLNRQVFTLRDRLEQLGYDQKPCHNDLVAANLVKNREGRLFLIDWEYAGLNDPMFDIAALFLENEFSSEDEELFFHYYFGGEAPERCREKILIFKISQDFLWSIWTVLKEAKGDNFGSYGQDRFNRCLALVAQFDSI